MDISTVHIVCREISVCSYRASLIVFNQLKQDGIYGMVITCLEGDLSDQIIDI